MYRKQLILTAACVIAAAQASAAVQDIHWDIGRQPDISSQLEPGQYRLIAHGAVSGASYKQSVGVETLPIPGLAPLGSVPNGGLGVDSSETVAPPPPAFTDKDKKIDPCDPYFARLDKLSKDATNAYKNPDLTKRSAEETFSFALAAFHAAIEMPDKGCTAPAKASSQYATLDRVSTVDLGTFPVKRGQTLKARISRALGDDAEGAKFAYDLTTGKRGSWQASYGFGITPDRDRKFFSQAGDDDSFTIKQKRSNGGLQPNAAVFYTWLPSKWETTFCSFGIAGGIGVDQNNLVLLVGPHLTFNQNFGLVAGVALHQETRLRGEYDVGQVVSENLTSDALEEKTDRTSWFIGVTYRFAEAEK